MTAIIRIKKELSLIAKNNFEYFTLGPRDTANLFELEGFILGPAGTPYEGGCFEFEIHLGKDYPLKPPEFRFTTKIFHPNVNDKGYVSLEIIQEKNWTPAYLFYMIIIQVYYLFSYPD